MLYVCYLRVQPSPHKKKKNLTPTGLELITCLLAAQGLAGSNTIAMVPMQNARETRRQPCHEDGQDEANSTFTGNSRV